MQQKKNKKKNLNCILHSSSYNMNTTSKINSTPSIINWHIKNINIILGF
jgi:hypothetical protein